MTDHETPQSRLFLHRRRRYPWWIALIALVLFAYGLTQAIDDYAGRVEFRVERNCGL